MKNINTLCLLCILLFASCSASPAVQPGPTPNTISAAENQIQAVPIQTVASATPEPHAVNSPTPPPNCRRIAFSALKDNQFDIYTICPDGQNLTQLTNTPRDDTQPAWSPDGQFIAFTSYQSNIPQVYLMQKDGSDIHALTHSDWSYFSPIWLPDGQNIACLKTNGKGIFQWVTIQTDGSNEQPLTEPTYVFFDTWAWSPDNQHIAYVSYEEQKQRNDGTGEIHVMKADRSDNIRLTQNVWRDTLPVWSPDSQQIAFLSDRQGNPRIFALYLMDADGSNQHPITENNLDPNRLSWSPDGKTIAFDGYLPSPSGGIFLVDIQTNNIKPLVENSGLQSIGFPAWQP